MTINYSRSNLIVRDFRACESQSLSTTFEQALMSVGGARLPTLLLIDDEPSIVRMLMEAFKGSSIRLFGATGCDEALHLYRDNYASIDLVLMDVELHPLSGHQLLVQLQQLNPLVRVVLMSGTPFSEPEKELRRSGVVAVYNKPFLSLMKLKNDLLRLIDLDPGSDPS